MKIVRMCERIYARTIHLRQIEMKMSICKTKKVEKNFNLTQIVVKCRGHCGNAVASEA